MTEMPKQPLQPEEQQKKKFFWVLFSALFVISVILGIASSTTSFRDFIRQMVLKGSREVLAKADAVIDFETQERLVVLKVKTADSLALEIFLADKNLDKATFIKRVVLPERRDGHFNFRGNAVNLVMADVDGDKILDIIAPAFDDNLVPRLNVFKYIPDTRDILRMGPETEIAL